MNRRLAGILAICLVLSTEITLFIIGGKTLGATVIENSFPKAIYRSREKGTFAFHHGMVSRQSFASMTMEFYALKRIQTNLTLTVEEITVERLSEDLPSVSLLERFSSSLGSSPTLHTYDIEVNDERITLQLLDFTNVFDVFAPEEIKAFPEGGRSGLIASPSATLSFAFLFDESGAFLSAYEGVRDFFIDREMTLADLYIRRNEETMSFTSARMSPQPKGQRMLDAPKRGRLSFEDVERDDRFEVGFSVNGAWLPGSVTMIQLIVVYGDRELLYAQPNFIV